jgi:hypothetical protein
LPNLTKLLYLWNVLLSVALAVAVAVAMDVAVAIAKAQTPLFSLLVSKMSVLDNVSLF